MTSRARLGLAAFVLVLGVSVPAFGFNGLSTPPSGDNQMSSVTQGIGPVKVTIDYSSPRVVRGKNDRKGKIWGELVPWGMADLGANSCKSCPWRAGANENTLFTVSHEVKVQGQKLAAGKYGLFMIPGQDEWTIVFSRDTEAWGAFWYDPAHDVLRVKTKAGKSDYHEFLSYEFTEREPAKATVALKWEELQVPFSITVDNPDQIYVDMMRAELSTRGLQLAKLAGRGGLLRPEEDQPSGRPEVGGKGYFRSAVVGRPGEFRDAHDPVAPPGGQRQGPGSREDLRQGAQPSDGCPGSHSHGRPGAPDRRKEGPGDEGLSAERQALPQPVAGSCRPHAGLRGDGRREEGAGGGEARGGPGARRRQQEKPSGHDQEARRGQDRHQLILSLR